MESRHIASGLRPITISWACFGQREPRPKQTAYEKPHSFELPFLIAKSGQKPGTEHRAAFFIDSIFGG